MSNKEKTHIYKIIALMVLFVGVVMYFVMTGPFGFTTSDAAKKELVSASIDKKINKIGICQINRMDDHYSSESDNKKYFESNMSYISIVFDDDGFANYILKINDKNTSATLINFMTSEQRKSERNNKHLGYDYDSSFNQIDGCFSEKPTLIIMNNFSGQSTVYVNDKFKIQTPLNAGIKNLIQKVEKTIPQIIEDKDKNINPSDTWK